MEAEGMILQEPELIRTVARQLLEDYVPNDTGDEKFKEIAGDYGGSGTTCGFLCHWLMWRLGCRDGKTVNRTDHDSGLKYVIAKNVSKIRWGGYFVPYEPGTRPELGDILFISNGPPITEHVMVFCEEEDDKGGPIWTTADGGQTNKQGKQCMRIRHRRFLLGGTLENADSPNRNPRRVQGWISLTSLPLTAPYVPSLITV